MRPQNNTLSQPQTKALALHFLNGRACIKKGKMKTPINIQFIVLLLTVLNADLRGAQTPGAQKHNPKANSKHLGNSFKQLISSLYYLFLTSHNSLKLKEFPGNSDKTHLMGKDGERGTAHHQAPIKGANTLLKMSVKPRWHTSS